MTSALAPALYRIVASDLDGTLLHRTAGVTPRTLTALAVAEAAGAHVVFVTGRPVRRLTPLADAGLTGPVICNNGAVVYDLASGEVLRSVSIPNEVLAGVLSALRTAIPGITFSGERLSGFVREEGYLPRLDAGSEVAVATTFEELLGEGIVKLKARHEELPSDKMLALAAPVLEGVLEVSHAGSPGPGQIEMTAPGVTKGSALDLFALERGLTRMDAVAFGDMPNDLPMFAWAGRSYAMEGAHPEALAAATDVAPPNGDEGVAQVLEVLYGDGRIPSQR